MDISKILNPAPSASGDSSKQKRKKDQPQSPPAAERGSGSKDWEELRRKRGMPKEGLNTFRVKSQ